MVPKKNGGKAKSLAEQAHGALEDLIVTLQLPPGSLWTEIELCERIGIGRTPVHEAVQKLASQHLITVMRRHGLMISNVNIEEQLLVLETRRELDRLISARAARRISEEEKKDLLKQAAKMMQASAQGDTQDFLRRHFAIKKFTAQCARNPFAADAIAPLLILSLRFYYIYHNRIGDSSVVANLHYDVVKAIVAGDEELAAKASEAVADYNEKFTRDIFLQGM